MSKLYLNKNALKHVVAGITVKVCADASVNTSCKATSISSGTCEDKMLVDELIIAAVSLFNEGDFTIDTSGGAVSCSEF